MGKALPAERVIGMNRITELMDGWEFALFHAEKGVVLSKEKQPEEDCYRPVAIPHDWVIAEPFDREMEQGGAQGFRRRTGIGWYRKSFSLKKKEPQGHYFLKFGGIFEQSTIWINGNEAGGQKYGYTTFELEITDFVKDGENQILVRVDNTAFPADRWYSGGGIYRTVTLRETKEAWIDRMKVKVKAVPSADESSGMVQIDWNEAVHPAVASGVGSAIEIEAVLKKDGCEISRKRLEANAGTIGFTIENPKLWSAESPELYEVLLTIFTENQKTESDRQSWRIGFRREELIPNQGLYINGKPVKLNGVCIHQDGGSCGIAVRPETWRSRLLLLKEMGCNAIRAAHHLYAEEFLDLCDELGFYVYEECFDKWKSGLYARYFDTEWKKDLACMVERDRHRPSIVIWGVGNEVENQGQKSMLKILEMLTAQVRLLDPDRPVSYAMNPHFKRESNLDLSKVKDIQKYVDEIDDREIYGMEERIERIRGIAAHVDLISCNYQEQWYEEIHRAMPEKLILGTETYQFFLGNRDQMQNFTANNPALVPETMPWVIGGMIWTGIDYLGESMGYPAKGWSGAMIRTNGEKKPGYYLIQSYWAKKPMVHFSVMDYSLMDEGVKEHWDLPILADHWQFPQFHKTVIPYMIFSNCEEVRLELNGKRFFLPKPKDCPNRLITGFLPWQPGTVTVSGYNDGVCVCSHTVKTPGPAVRLQFKWGETLQIPAKKGYELLLSVQAADEEGNPYFREQSFVHFAAEGPVRILGTDNGCLMSSEPYQEPAVHLYQGQAAVRAALTGETGRAVISAFADGMQTARLMIEIVGEEEA